jgi:hypothetical protein
MDGYQTPAWDVWDWLEASGIAATLLTSLGVITSPKARRQLGGFATAAAATTGLVKLLTPPRCPACGTRQSPHASQFGYFCPRGCA